MVRFHLAPHTWSPAPPFVCARPVATAPSVHSAPVKAFRRGLIVALIAVIVGGFVRLRGKGGVPPTSGGWRELEGPEFR